MERRKKDRATKPLTLTAELRDEPTNSELSDRILNYTTNNISVTGISVAGDVAVPVGSRLNMVLSSESPNVSFKLAGQVRWVTSAEDHQLHFLGIQFLYPDSPESKVWRKFVQKYISRAELHSDERGKGHQFSKDENSPWH